MLGEGRGFSQDETSHSSYLTTLQERLEADSGGLRMGRATLPSELLSYATSSSLFKSKSHVRTLTMDLGILDPFSCSSQCGHIDYFSVLCFSPGLISFKNYTYLLLSAYALA